MFTSSAAPCRGLAPARRSALIAGAVAAVLTLAGCSAGFGSQAPSTGVVDSVETDAPASSASPAAPPAAPAGAAPQAAVPAAGRPAGVTPASIIVPAMELDEPIIPLGIQGDGTMEVPEDYDDVGWFTGGGSPGGFGPTVIAGHVDSRSGPAVFFRLAELVVGDRFSLAGVDGRSFEYEVYKIEDHAKAEFPTVDVFGATLEDEVRLITCGGEYDQSIGRYTDNLVVFAKGV